MKVEKAYILTIDTPTSQKYLVDAIKSCEIMRFPWDEYKGFCDIPPFDALSKIGVNKKIPFANRVPRGALSMIGHMGIIKKIMDNKECAVILEHDAVMIQPVTVDIPDGEIVVLGYKLKNIERYNSKRAGLPTRLISIDGHEGAHAYALTWRTAEMIWEEFLEVGIQSDSIDNHYFLKERKNFTKIPLSITDPICSLGWIRDSTIWNESSTDNYDFIDSFKSNLN